MLHSTEILPILIGFALSWFVILGTRELIKEASMAVVKKSIS